MNQELEELEIEGQVELEDEEAMYLDEYITYVNAEVKKKVKQMNYEEQLDEQWKRMNHYWSTTDKITLASMETNIEEAYRSMYYKSMTEPKFKSLIEVSKFVGEFGSTRAGLATLFG